MSETEKRKPTVWQLWLHRPEQVWLRKAMFQIHFWLGAAVGAYVLLMSLSGSLLVYRNELSKKFSLDWLVNFHKTLLLGPAGRFVNGIGAISPLVERALATRLWHGG